MVRKCQICGCELTTERKFCKECKKARKREYAKSRYLEMINNGIKKQRYGITNCIFCGKEIIKNKPDQDTCFDCYKLHKHKTVDNYNNVKRSKNGNTLGRETIKNLGLNINNMVIHHIDENPENNKLNNLMILNRKSHASLHRFLEKNWSLLLKSSSSNLENCWNILRGQLTTTYLETKDVKVLKITDIRQSAAELLNEDYIYIFDSQEEGSETMYQVPKSNAHGKEIVQTQTTM